MSVRSMQERSQPKKLDNMLRLKSNLKIKSSIIDTAPLVDVVLLLLIFFILNNLIVFLPGIKINLPETREYTMIPANKMIVFIPSVKNSKSEEHLVFFDNKVVGVSDFERLFREKLRQNKEVNARYSRDGETMQTVLLIKADILTPIGLISQIREVARQQGVATIEVMEEKDGK